MNNKRKTKKLKSKERDQLLILTANAILGIYEYFPDPNATIDDLKITQDKLRKSLNDLGIVNSQTPE